VPKVNNSWLLEEEHLALLSAVAEPKWKQIVWQTQTMKWTQPMKRRRAAFRAGEPPREASAQCRVHDWRIVGAYSDLQLYYGAKNLRASNNTNRKKYLAK
jgi:hypothetical protein